LIKRVGFVISNFFAEIISRQELQDVVISTLSLPHPLDLLFSSGVRHGSHCQLSHPEGLGTVQDLHSCLNVTIKHVLNSQVIGLNCWAPCLLWLRFQFEHADKSEDLSEGIPPLSVDLVISGVSVLACMQVPHLMVIIDAPAEVIMQLHEVNVGVSKERIQGAHYEELLFQLL